MHFKIGDTCVYIEHVGIFYFAITFFHNSVDQCNLYKSVRPMFSCNRCCLVGTFSMETKHVFTTSSFDMCLIPRFVGKSYDDVSI